MLPFLVMTGTGLLILVLDPLMAPERRDRLPLVALAGVATAAATLLLGWGEPEMAFGGMLAADGFAFFCNLLFLLVAGLALLLEILSREDVMDCSSFADDTLASPICCFVPV